jgi:hypothetical protein
MNDFQRMNKASTEQGYQLMYFKDSTDWQDKCKYMFSLQLSTDVNNYEEITGNYSLLVKVIVTRFITFTITFFFL